MHCSLLNCTCASTKLRLCMNQNHLVCIHCTGRNETKQFGLYSGTLNIFLLHKLKKFRVQMKHVFNEGT